jgi:DNA-binding LytR/AlgR family response regulator
MISLEATFTDAIGAMAYLKKSKTDLLILDIMMPDINGIKLFRALPEKPLVIFTTAHPQFAVEGFELEAIDYLMKPVKFDRFLKALQKAEKALASRTGIHPGKENFIVVKSGYKSVRLAVNEIEYVEGLDDYVKFHMSGPGNPMVLSLMSLKSVLEKMPAGQFIRVHRSFVVPVKKIQSIRNKMITVGNRQIPIGDTYIEAIQQWLRTGF